MIYLAAIFVSPLALLAIGKWVQATVNLVFYLAAWFFLITIFGFFPFGVGAWGIGVLHAVLTVNRHSADKRNRELIEAMKEVTR